MKIIVIRESGVVEDIELVEPLTAHCGEYLNRITDAAGVDHFFTLSGHYDGQGGLVVGLDSESGEPLLERWRRDSR